MHRVHRSLLLTGVVALGLAGCGDDVTVTEAPPTPTPAPSIAITPASATVAAGSSIDFGVTVTNSTAAFTCAVTPSTLGTVSVVGSACRLAAGASATGAGTVTATLTGANISASAAVNVTAVVPTNVQLTFKSLTQGALLVPVNLAAVAGQVDATVNLNPNGNAVDSVVVFFDYAAPTGARQAAVQRFTGIPASGDIVFNINTAAYTKAAASVGTTTVVFNNATVPVRAVAYRGGNALATAFLPSSLPSNSMTLANVDGFAADLTLGANRANDAAGLTWWGGPGAGGMMSIQVWPVLYTPGRSITSVTFGFGGAAPCTDTSLPFACTFGYGTGITPTVSVAGYQTAVANPGETVVVASSIDQGNNPGPAGLIANTVVPGSTPALARVDYAAPTSGAFQLVSLSGTSTTLNIGNVESWVNAAYDFRYGYGTACPTGITGCAGTAPTDAGVGVGTTQFIVGTGGYPTTGTPNRLPVTIVDSSTGVIPASIANSATNLVYVASARANDRLGNWAVRELSTPAAPHLAQLAFGVDRTAPTLANCTTATPGCGATLAADAVTNTGGNFQVFATDTLSGFLLNTSCGVATNVCGMDHLLARVTGGTTANAAPVTTFVAGSAFSTPTTTPLATSGAGSAIGNFSTGVIGYIPSGVTPTQIIGPVVAATTPNGYYIYQARARDRAGNLATLITRRAYVNDNNVPVITGFQGPLGPVAGGSTVPVTILANDAPATQGLDLVAGDIRVGYAALGAAPFLYPKSTIGATFDDTINNFTQTTVQATNFIDWIQAAPAGVPGAVGSAGPVSVTVYNGFGNTAGATSGISAAQVVPVTVSGTGTNFGAAGPNQTQTWIPTSSCTSSSVAYPRTTTCTITFTAQGPSGTYTSPFTNGVLVLEGSTAAPTSYLLFGSAAPAFTPPFNNGDNGVIRIFRWTVTVSKTVPAAATFTYVGLGLNSSWDGLATDPTTPAAVITF